MFVTMRRTILRRFAYRFLNVSKQIPASFSSSGSIVSSQRRLQPIRVNRFGLKIQLVIPSDSIIS